VVHYDVRRTLRVSEFGFFNSMRFLSMGDPKEVSGSKFILQI
jgi:hypothetical protein